MRDEGIGLVIVQRLEKVAARFPNVEFVEAGTSLMAAVHRMAGRKKAVFVDCAFMGEAPGTLRRFTPDEARSVKRLGGMSLHEGDLMAALDFAKRFGDCPDEVVIWGIEPATVEMGESLSDLLQERLDSYVGAVTRELSSCAL